MANRRKVLAGLATSLALPPGAWWPLHVREDAAELSLEAPPMLGRVTRDSAEVSLYVSTPGETRVVWGRGRNDLSLKQVSNELGDLRFHLDLSSRAKRYWYRVDRLAEGSSRWVRGAVTGFRTQRPMGSRFRFALLADAHLIRDDNQDGWYDPLRRCTNLVAAEDLDFVVFLGDESCIDGSGNSLAAVNSQREADTRYALLRRLYAPILGSIPAFFVLGNHDGERYYRHPHLMRWGANARKRYLLNPGPTTYPEGGEHNGWSESGHWSPLENYYAWSWGDATFVVLDPFRYTRNMPCVPEDWTLGDAQLRWAAKVLRLSRNRHKFVICHHLVGGGRWNAAATAAGAYGRGGARMAHLGEQAQLNRLMQRYGARFFLYGHDHIFAHGGRDDIEYICGGRPWRMSSNWWGNPGWAALYGDEFLGVAGYTVFDVSPERVELRYVVLGKNPREGFKWDDAPMYRVQHGGVIRVADRVRGEPTVWVPHDPTPDLFQGGTYRNRTIRLGPGWQGKVGDEVRVVHPGQVAYQRSFPTS